MKPTRRFLLGVFEDEDDILAVTRASREQGLTITDVYAPYPVHGLEDAMDLRPSRLPWIAFALGALGAAAKVWFEYWTTAFDWPINVGGKPWDSLPAFVPVTFEVMVLFAGVGTVIAFLIGRNMFPGRKPKMPRPRVTDDQFVLVVEQVDASFDVQAVRDLFHSFNATQTEERIGLEAVQ